MNPCGVQKTPLNKSIIQTGARNQAREPNPEKHSCSSPKCDLCTKTCNVTEGDCNNRKNTLCGSQSAKKYTCYELDTCLIQYKPRLIRVPSEKYPTMDDALLALEPYKGGYVVKLDPGTYCLNASLCQSVDSVRFIGDCSPLVGVGFIQTCRTSAIDFHNACPASLEVGQRPYSLMVCGNEIIVTGANGCNPDFSSLDGGRQVGIVSCNGTITRSQVKGGRGNRICLECAPPLGQQPQVGEGFFILPNTILTSTSIEVRLFVSETLEYEGLQLKVPFPFVTGTHGLAMDIRHCVIYNLHINGRYYITQPNVHLGLTVLTPASHGEAFYQTFVGIESRLLADSIAYSAWNLTTVASTINGVKLQNGSGLNLYGSDFVNNFVGLVVHARSSATVQGCFFCSNQYAIQAYYMSCISSYQIDGDPQASYAPTFQDNFVAINAGYSSMVLIPNSIIQNNSHAFLLDTRFRSTLESNAVGDYGPLNSLIIPIPNPVAPDKITSFLNVPDVQDLLAGTYLNATGANGTVTHSTIANAYNQTGASTGSVQGSSLQDASGTYTGVANGPLSGPACTDPATLSNCQMNAICATGRSSCRSGRCGNRGGCPSCGTNNNTVNAVNSFGNSITNLGNTLNSTGSFGNGFGNGNGLGGGGNGLGTGASFGGNSNSSLVNNLVNNTGSGSFINTPLGQLPTPPSGCIGVGSGSLNTNSSNLNVTNMGNGAGGLAGFGVGGGGLGGTNGNTFGSTNGIGFATNGSGLNSLSSANVNMASNNFF